LELLVALQGNIRKKITIPAIGMGLWRSDPHMVLRKIKEWENKTKNIRLEIIISDKTLFRTISEVMDDINPKKHDENEYKDLKENESMDLSTVESEEEDMEKNTDVIDGIEENPKPPEKEKNMEILDHKILQEKKSRG